MALSDLAEWTSRNTAHGGTACGADDKPAACGASDKPAACGASDKPAACGTACGAGDK